MGKMRLPNGFGSITKMKGNRRNPYRVRFTTGYDEFGRQLSLDIGYVDSYAKGVALLTEYHKNPFTKEHKNLTLEDVYNAWYLEKIQKIKPKSLISYTSVWNYCSSIKEIPFIKLNLHDMQHVINSLGDKSSQKKNLKSLFNQLYDYAIMNGINIIKYSQYLDIGKQDTKLERIPFTEDEISILWENINRMEYIDVLLIYIYTGFRPSELLEITKDNVFLAEGYLKGGLKTKAGKNRIVPIHHKIMPLIEKWYYKNSSNFLITNSKGTQLLYRNWKDEKFGKIMEQLEMDHLPHDTRHTFATRMDEVGANKLCIKRILGHASKDITDKVYTHKDINQLKEAIELLP